MKHLKGQQYLFTKICIESEEKSWVINKTLQIFAVLQLLYFKMNSRQEKRSQPIEII